VSPNGNLYVNGADKIYVISSKGELLAAYLVEYGTSPVAFDNQSNAYVVTKATLQSPKLSKVIIFDQYHKEKQVFEYESENNWLEHLPAIGKDGVVYVGGLRTIAIKF
jgi:hypothetical protein